MDISVENQRREKMFNDMNNRALRSTANQISAKRIINFMNPKNIVNNPRRVSGGGFFLFTSMTRRLSKESGLSSVATTGGGRGAAAASSGGPADGTIEEGDGESQERTKS
jgi:hypothetical protein